MYRKKIFLKIQTSKKFNVSSRKANFKEKIFHRASDNVIEASFKDKELDFDEFSNK